MPSQERLKVAVLVDLPRTPESGGHVKCWERMAAALVGSDLPLDLTVYFSGKENTEILGSNVRLTTLPPVFSTAHLKFLPYIPDHTDLASYHMKLAQLLPQYDVIHTTDGFFAFAQTAANISYQNDIPLVTSFHTDTPSYTRIFTHQTLDKLFSWCAPLRNLLVDTFKIPERKERDMMQKLRTHVTHCDHALVTRREDHDFAEAILGADHVHHLRLGIDKNLFNPARRDRTALEKTYNIPDNKIILLFVGRVDIGKNIYTLVHAMTRLIAKGLPLHLVVAGKGPASTDVKNILGENVTLAGYVMPDDLAKLYASVDGLALSSEVEIRSMAGVEAMASGCPVLVSAKSGVAVLFNNTPAMQVVESGEDHWAAAIEEFATNPTKRAAMRDAALDYSANHLARWIDILTDDVFAVWQKAARNEAPRA